MVHNLTFEANPKLAPTRLLVGVVVVLFARKEEYYRAPFDALLCDRLRLEKTSAFGDVDDLVLVQYATALSLEIVGRRVLHGRVAGVGLDELCTHGCGGQTPAVIVGSDGQIFQRILVYYFHLLSNLKYLISFLMQET